MKDFFMPMKPPTVTAQQKNVVCKSGKPVFIDKPELADAKDKLMAHLSKHKLEQPLQGPVRLVVKWLFPKIKGKSDGDYKDTKPDTDNLQKALKDCMEKLGFFTNDSQVASEIVEKFWADKPGIYIAVGEL